MGEVRRGCINFLLFIIKYLFGKEQKKMKKSIKLKHFTTFAILAFMLISVVWFFAQSSSSSTLFDHITLTWTNNPTSTMTITWRADSKIKNGVVQYQKGMNLNNSAQSVKALSSVFNTDLGRSALFTSTLTNLSPDTRYTYRVGNGKIWSSAHNFCTAAVQASKFKFLVFGDSQSLATGKNPYIEWKQTVRNAYKANPDAKFFINTGDLVDVGQSEAHWNGWFAGAAGVLDTIPVMPVVGNHETFGFQSIGRPVFWTENFTLPSNGPNGLKEQVYSYNYGVAHFAVLDSQQDEEIGYGDILPSQETWLDKDLKSSRAMWKFAFFHKTPYDLLSYRGNDKIRAGFCPVLEKYHTDVVFSGHDHGVARTYPFKNNQIMKKPSQGTIYHVTGRSGFKAYPDIIKKSWNPFFYNPMDQPNYLVVEVDNTKLTIKTVKMNGTIVNTFFLDKKKDISSDSH